jgi:hypothetical protein
MHAWGTTPTRAMIAEKVHTLVTTFNIPNPFTSMTILQLLNYINIFI